MSDASKEFTPGEYAAHYARKRRLPHGVLFTTGRMLVKKTFEDTALPPEISQEELSQYVAPELHKLGAFFYRTAVILSDGEERTMWGRHLAINEAARDNTLDIVAYDRNGRVETP